MKLDELRGTITHSAKKDWHPLTCWGGNGPSYLNSYSTWSGPDGWGGIEVESHSNLAVYRADIDLKLAWGLPRDGRDEKLHLPWQDRFPNPKVTAYFVDVIWRGSLVDRDTHFAVDGGRAYLPSGHAKYENQENPDPTTWRWITDEVTPWEYHLTKLVHSFEPSEDFDRYFERAGMTRLPGAPSGPRVTVL